MTKVVNFFKIIKLYENYSINTNLSPIELKLKLENSIDKTSFNLFDSFSSGRSEFMGSTTEKGFELRRTPKSFSKRDTSLLVKGEFIEQNGKTKINITIDGFDLWFKILYSLELLFLIVMITFFFYGNKTSIDNPLFINILIWILPLFFVLGPYLQRKRSIEQLAHDLERELHFILTKTSTSKNHSL